MSDESKAKAVSEHAVVKQEHRREAKRFCDAVDFLEKDELAQFLADHDAEVERKKDAYIAALYGEIHRQITNALECFEQHDTQNGIRKLKVMLHAEPRFHEKEALAEVERKARLDEHRLSCDACLKGRAGCGRIAALERGEA